MRMRDLEKYIDTFKNDINTITTILETKEFSIITWQPDMECIESKFYLYDNELYLCTGNVTSSTFPTNNMKQMSGSTESLIREILNTYFYNKGTRWIRCEASDSNAHTVVADDEISFDENTQAKISEVQVDIEDISLGETVKQEEIDIELYVKKEDVYTKNEIDVIVNDLKSLMHTHETWDSITKEYIQNRFGLVDTTDDKISSLINDKTISLVTTWSSYKIDKVISTFKSILNNYASGGMSKVVVDTIPSPVDTNVIYFLKKVNEDSSIVYKVMVFTDASDTEEQGIVLNETNLTINGDDVATTNWVINKLETSLNAYAKKVDLSKIAFSGSIKDLKDIPGGLMTLKETTLANYNSMTDEEKTSKINGLTVLWYVPIE